MSCKTCIVSGIEMDTLINLTYNVAYSFKLSTQMLELYAFETHARFKSQLVLEKTNEKTLIVELDFLINYRIMGTR